MRSAIRCGIQRGGADIPAKSIDGIVVELTEIVERARANTSRIGYFAAMLVREGLRR